MQTGFFFSNTGNIAYHLIYLYIIFSAYPIQGHRGLVAIPATIELEVGHPELVTSLSQIRKSIHETSGIAT